MSITKNTFARIAATICAAIVLSIFFALNSVSFKTFAAEAESVTETETADTEKIINKDDGAFTVDGVEFVALANDDTYEVVQLAAGGGGAGNGSGSTTADSSYKSVINFFITWIRRIGAMVAGFVAFAICLAADMFDLFS